MYIDTSFICIDTDLNLSSANNQLPHRHIVAFKNVSNVRFVNLVDKHKVVPFIFVILHSYTSLLCMVYLQ